MAASERLAPVTYLFGDRREPSHSATDTPTSPQRDVTPQIDRGEHARASRRAENVSIAGLARRNMSRWEVEQLLISRELDRDVIAAELERLEGVGLIDDAALAETLVRTKRERKGLGYQALVAELRRRHIDHAIIDAALADTDDGDEQQRASELAEKRAMSLSSYDRETATRRLTGYLMRKGYSSSIVHTAVSEALNTSPAGATSGVRFQ